MEEWASLFQQVQIAAPCREVGAPADSAEIRAKHVRISPLPELGGRKWQDKAGLVVSLPMLCWALIEAMRGAEAIHVRCPGNVGLMSAALAPLFSRRLIAKYAGQWRGYRGEPWSYRAQRWILRSRWWKGPVVVYGEWPGEPEHVVPFFNSALTEGQMDRARLAASHGRRGGLWQILFVGRLSAAKQAETVIRACGRLSTDGLQLRCELIGEGPELGRLRALVHELGLERTIRLQGGASFEGVLEAYEKADLLVLPSETEGWPKVLAEAMAFGVPCVATDRGLNPWMLGEGRGLTAKFGDVEGFAAAIRTILTEDEDARRRRRAACAEFGQRYSIDDVREGLRGIMERAWGVKLAGAAQ
jgi:glycosyltransferase involved in cell wall biosynthesis